MNRGAEFSPCRAWRYTLSRFWDLQRGLVLFVGLNPSTADETQDDPTVRRCIGFVRDWGYGGLVMGNLFAFRATDPKVMKAAADPAGPDNDYWLAYWMRKSEFAVAAWGTHGTYLGQADHVLQLLIDLGDVYSLGTTKGGQPRHPLYLPKTARRELIGGSVTENA